MENITIIGTIISIHFLGLIIPGPDFIMTIKNSLQYSRKTGIFTALGLALGMVVHIIYCMAGLALIISQSIIIFNFIKLLGAVYLIYIGIKSIFSKSSEINVEETVKKNEELKSFEAIKMGFLTNILNPKATLFFLGLFTLVIVPDTSKITIGFSSLIMIANTFLWFSLVSIFFTQKKVQSIFSKFQNLFNKVFGGLLIALGIKVALSQK